MRERDLINGKILFMSKYMSVGEFLEIGRYALNMLSSELDEQTRGVLKGKSYFNNRHIENTRWLMGQFAQVGLMLRLKSKSGQIEGANE